MIQAKKQSHFMLILVCLLCNIFVRPFNYNTQFNAKTSIVGAIIGFLLFAAIAFIFFKIASPPNFGIVKLCLLILFFSTSAATIVKAEQFYRFISDKQLPVIVFFAVFVAVIAYCAQMPKNALARSAVAVAILSILTVALIIISNFKDINLQRLDITFNDSLIKSGLHHFNFSAEILLFYVLASNSNEKQNSFTGVLLIVLVIYCIFQVLGEAVMGTAAVLQTQPINTLSKIGSISVFQRLDSFYSAIWLLGMLIKSVAFYVYGFSLLENKSKAKHFAAIGFLAVLIFVAYSVAYSSFVSVLNIASIALAILICVLSLLKRSENCEKAC